MLNVLDMGEGGENGINRDGYRASDESKTGAGIFLVKSDHRMTMFSRISRY
jgi:hypothetical protein